MLFAAVGTRTVTVSVAVRPPGSVTVSVKTRTASFVSAAGALKVGAAVAAPVSNTVGEPPVWDQAYVRVPPSGSLLALPSSVTVAPCGTRRSGPAFAVGAGLSSTVTVTVSAAEARPPGSVTVRLKVRSVSAVTLGAVKVGHAVAAPVRFTVGEPPVWVQAYVSVWFSGSLLPLPSRLTAAPSRTVRSSPASAVGAVLACTVTVTVSAVDVLPPAVTVRLNVSVAAEDGAVKLGFGAALFESLTDVPAVWVQAYLRTSPSGSLLPLPSRVAVAPVATVRSGPASAVGAVLFAAVGTVTVTVSVAVSPPGSVTFSVKTSVASLARFEGATKVGFAVLAPVRVTAGKAVRVQAYVSARFSGSVLALPSSVTVAPSAARRSGPASATGGAFAADVTVIVTASAADVLPPAATVRLKVRVSVSPAVGVGAVKLGCWTAALLRATVVPPVWVQAQVSASPSGSLLALPSSVTGVPPVTVRSAPAFAVGAWLFAAAVTVIVTVSAVEARPCGSVTVRLKVSVSSFARLEGVVKAGCATVALSSATAVPAVWVQA